jgi:hypothetical protein
VLFSDTVWSLLSLSLPDTFGAGWASGPAPPQGNHKGPTSPRHHPCPYYDTEPPAGPTRGHRKGGGTYALALLENVSGRELLSLDALTDYLDKLRYTQEIALTVFNPGYFDRPHQCHTVDGLQGGHIVLFKDHSSCFKSSDLGLDIVNRPAKNLSQ